MEAGKSLPVARAGRGLYRLEVRVAWAFYPFAANAEALVVGLVGLACRIRGSRGEQDEAAHHGDCEGKGRKGFCDIHVIVLFL
jgi:hypothetical protein